MLFSLSSAQTRKKPHIFKETFKEKKTQDVVFEIELIIVLFFKSALKKHFMAYFMLLLSQFTFELRAITF